MANDILVSEDDPGIARNVRLYLERDGRTVTTASDGRTVTTASDGVSGLNAARELGNALDEQANTQFEEYVQGLEDDETFSSHQATAANDWSTPGPAIPARWLAPRWNFRFRPSGQFPGQTGGKGEADPG